MLTSTTLQAILNVIIAIVEGLLGLRLILKLFGASAQAPFVNWIYETSSSLIAPFEGMFPHPVLEGGFVIEFSTLFALFVYTFVGYLIGELMDFLTYHKEKYHKSKK